MPFSRRDNHKRVAIVVLGDIGRSPRMQYHALSFAKNGFKVALLGYSGSSPIPEILNSDDIDIHHIPEPPTILQRIPGSFILKAIWQAIVLLLVLLGVVQPQCFLLQNPPGVPAMAVTWIAARLRRCKMVVDWHNYGYTILQLKLPPSSVLVRAAKWMEFYFGRKSDLNLCVTRAMEQDLHVNHGIQARVLYDRPAESLGETTVSEKHELFTKLAEQYTQLQHRDDAGNLFTSSSRELRPDRPAILLSSTSWTEDEDFSVLLSALDEYEKNIVDGAQDLPNLVCIITGKGPLKDFYKGLIAQRQFKHVDVCTPWLEAEDYPKIVGSADLGVCLHLSSSGLDLPMKVIDMFGCNLPVCAINFSCLSELVRDGVNGRIFNNSEELASQIMELLRGFPDSTNKLNSLRGNIKHSSITGWHDNWTSIALPLFRPRRPSACTERRSGSS